jgi:hypothetical protein
MGTYQLRNSTLTVLLRAPTNRISNIGTFSEKTLLVALFAGSACHLGDQAFCMSPWGTFLQCSYFQRSIRLLQFAIPSGTTLFSLTAISTQVLFYLSFILDCRAHREGILLCNLPSMTCFSIYSTRPPWYFFRRRCSERGHYSPDISLIAYLPNSPSITVLLFLSADFRGHGQEAARSLNSCLSQSPRVGFCLEKALPGWGLAGICTLSRQSNGDKFILMLARHWSSPLSSDFGARDKPAEYFFHVERASLDKYIHTRRLYF